VRARQALLIIGAALLAGGLGLVASVALYGPGPLMRSELGQWLAQNLLRASGPPGLVVAEIAAPVAIIRLPDLDGREHTLPSRGQRLLINYWASWCAPCRREMPLLTAFASRRPDGTEVVGIALDEPEDARAFLAEHPVSFTNLVEAPGERDSSVRMGNRRGVLPFTVLIDADGRLLKRHLGAFEDAEQLDQWASPAQ
jgi:thiol-disulfide isomerase/thioredoxin